MRSGPKTFCAWKPTRGPATCANCATSWSARYCSDVCRGRVSTAARRKRRPPTRRRSASRPHGRWRKSKNTTRCGCSTPRAATNRKPPGGSASPARRSNENCPRGRTPVEGPNKGAAGASDGVIDVELLAPALLPLLAAMIATLAYTLYWFHGYTEESLTVTLRDHLAVARQTLREFQDERQLDLQQLAESPQFRAALKRQDRAAIQRALQQLRNARGFTFLHLTGVAGNWLYESDVQRASKPSPLTDRAARGFAGAAYEVFRPEDLRRESSALPAQARVEWRQGQGLEERGMTLRLVQPIADEQEHVAMMLDAGLLLNRNPNPLYTVASRALATGSLPAGADPIISLLLDDTRVAVMSDDWANLVGTRLSAETRALLKDK